MASGYSNVDSGKRNTTLNYLRMSLASAREVPKLLQALLEFYMPHSRIYYEVKRSNYLVRTLNPLEWQILKVASINGYGGVDTNLAYKLMRSMNLVQPPTTRRWDSPYRLLANEITVGDDIERLRRMRNETVNRVNTNVSDNEVFSFFSELKAVARRFETLLQKAKNTYVSAIENVEDDRYLEDSEDGLSSKTVPQDEETVLLEGEYNSYENRICLIGPSNSGKSTLASILTGGNIPTTWESTNVLSIYYGRNGILLSEKKMSPIKDNDPKQDVLQKLQLGNPMIRQHSDILPAVASLDTSGNDAKIGTNKQKDRNLPIDEIQEHCKLPDLANAPPAESQMQLYAVNREILDVLRNKQYTVRVAPSDVIDFGGQDAFDMIHQLFISQRGNFCFLFDGRRNLREPLQDGRTISDLMIHWVNSVLTYCISRSKGFPKIVFAATHRDEFNEEDIEEIRTAIIAQIDDLFGNHPLRHHLIYSQLPIIDAREAVSTEMDNLKQLLVDIAFSQPTWGELMPVRWVPLQLSLEKLRREGKFIVSYSQLEEVNHTNGDLALNDEDIRSFLKIQHALGKLMFFGDALKQQIIITDPAYMVTVLRSFVTDEIFFSTEEPFRSILKSMHDTGILKRRDLFKLWEQKEYKHLLPYKEFIVGILIQLDILIEPKAYLMKQKDESVLDYYLVPCMAKKKDDTTFMKDRVTDRRSICMSYRFTVSPVQAAVGFRLFGACLSMWHLKEYNEQKLIFCDSVTVEIDKNHDVSVRVEHGRVNVYLVHRKSKEYIIPNVATSIQECITTTLENIFDFYETMFTMGYSLKSSFPFQIEFKVACGIQPCYAPSVCREMTPESKWICQNGKTHELKYLLYLFPAKFQVQEECSEECAGLSVVQLAMCPENRQLRRIVANFTQEDFRRFILHLDLSVAFMSRTIDQYHYNLSDAMFICLWTWRAKTANSSFRILQDALRESELTSHFLCESFKDNWKEIDGIPLRKEPTEELFRKLSQHIGIQVLQLGIELGLDLPCIEDIQYQRRFLPEQVYAVLTKWKQCNSAPCVCALAVALKSIDRGLPCLVEFFSQHGYIKKLCR